MELPDDLLTLSHQLAQADGASKASLRRAVSTAYYAVFHLLTTNAAKQLVPVKPESLRFRLGRMFDHAVVDDVCKLFSSERIRDAGELITDLEPELADLGRLFNNLREDRMIADYDLSFEPTHTWAKQAITMAQKAFNNWNNVKDGANAAVFMARLAFPKLFTRGR